MLLISFFDSTTEEDSIIMIMTKYAEKNSNDSEEADAEGDSVSWMGDIINVVDMESDAQCLEEAVRVQLIKQAKLNSVF